MALPTPDPDEARRTAELNANIERILAVRREQEAHLKAWKVVVTELRRISATPIYQRRK